MSPICLPVPVPSLLVSMEGVDELLGCVLRGGYSAGRGGPVVLSSSH